MNELLDFYWSDIQKGIMHPEQNKTFAEIDGKVVEYTEAMRHDQTPVYIGPHEKRFKDSRFLGTGTFHHLEPEK